MIPIARRIIKGTSIYGVGSVLSKVIGFLLIPIYTHYLTKSDYGIVAIFGVIISIMNIILGMGIPGAVTRHYFDYKDKVSFKKYIGTVFNFLLIIDFILIISMFLFSRPLFNKLLPNIPFYPYIILSFFTAYFMTMGKIILALYRAREQSLRYMIFIVSNFLLSLVLKIYFVIVLKEGALGPINGAFWTSFVFFLIYLIFSIRESEFSFSKSILKKALLFGLPIIPHSLSSWILTGIDRLLLAKMTSLSQVGLYNLGYQFGMILSIIMISFSFAYSPIYYDIGLNDRNAKKIFSKITTYYMAIISIIAISIILFSKEIFIVMVSSKFYGALVVIPVIVIGYFFNGFYFMNIGTFFLKNKTKFIAPITAFAAVINIIFNLLWIPKFGIMGAAYATLVAYTIQSIITHLIAQRIYKIPFEYGKLLFIFILLIVGYKFSTIIYFKNSVILIIIKMSFILICISSLFFLKIVTYSCIKNITKHNRNNSNMIY